MCPMTCTDMYEFLVYKEKRPSVETQAVSAGPPTGIAHEAPKEDMFGFAPGVDGWYYISYYISTDRYSFAHPALPGIEVRVGDEDFLGQCVSTRVIKYCIGLQRKWIQTM